MKSVVGHALAWLQAPLGPSSLEYSPTRCSADVLAKPDLFGAETINISAHEVIGHSNIWKSALENTASNGSSLDFCNVTVTYTHPGQHDTIQVTVWLPLENWNGRFLAAGGGGWITGLPYLSPALELGYAAASTNGGHGIERSAASWALTSPGNVNWNLLQDFAYRALDDLAVVGKAITTSFYETAPKYSYWNGCSTGGRQGLMLAQRSPMQFDGIVAAAPAIDWPTFVVSAFWAQQRMNRLNAYPSTCELNGFRAAAVEACDELDGLKDGIIGAPGLCDFDPHTAVGRTIECDGVKQKLTSEGATIAQAAWTGPINADGKASWFGVNYDAILRSAADAIVTRNDSTKGRNPTIPEEWISLFVKKDPSYDPANMTDAEFFSVLKASQREYDSIIGTNWPDLSEFRDAGGKMISWHGLADDRIPPNGTSHYYDRVLAETSNVSDFYRYFEAPGVGHCAGGAGAVPNALADLVKWVEEGIVPDTLKATGQNGDSTVRELCQYPLVQRYLGGDPKVASSFKCAASFA
ncbi:tannase and feruloyl esterase [Aureobasidium pullulans]|uniref:Carboxylic ester hydrolase n=1 Tax=Aureobasidium pullulans TaxID=5580 RepID=A0A4V4JX04_AURPU|nr:tannase and feruloyl esterase [Aureobasidium pullulans]